MLIYLLPLAGCDGLGLGDPQFSSPSLEYRHYDKAEDRIDDEDPDLTSLDPALLQAVLADPVLLRAVDPHVLQAVLVQAATANLQLDLDTARWATSETLSKLYFWVFLLLLLLLLCGWVTLICDIHHSLQLYFQVKVGTKTKRDIMAMTMTMLQINRKEGRGTREGASSLVY